MLMYMQGLRQKSECAPPHQNPSPDRVNSWNKGANKSHLLFNKSEYTRGAHCLENRQKSRKLSMKNDLTSQPIFDEESYKKGTKLKLYKGRNGQKQHSIVDLLTRHQVIPKPVRTEEGIHDKPDSKPV